MSEIEEGSRVRLARDVERYPHFVAEEGRTGIVVTMEDDVVAVRLDEKLEGAEEWGNQIHWYPDMYEEEDFLQVFKRDVRPES